MLRRFWVLLLSITLMAGTLLHAPTMASGASPAVDCHSGMSAPTPHGDADAPDRDPTQAIPGCPLAHPPLPPIAAPYLVARSVVVTEKTFETARWPQSFARPPDDPPPRLTM